MQIKHGLKEVSSTAHVYLFEEGKWTKKPTDIVMRSSI